MTDISTTPSADPKQAASEVAGAAKDQGREVASTAAEKAGDVIGTAKEQARTVGSEVQQHAATVLRDSTSELENQLGQRVEQAASRARDTSTQLRALAEGRVDEAADLVGLVQQLADRLSGWADRANDLGPRGLAQETARFARQRPLVFLGGAAAAGFLVGRVAKNAGSGSNGSSNGSPDGSSAPALAPTTGAALPGARPGAVTAGDEPGAGFPLSGSGGIV